MVRHLSPSDGRRELFIKWVSIQNWYYMQHQLLINRASNAKSGGLY